ncbi:arfaptin-1 isoform X3 [Synchiropus splendidus]|uniref:arfaptin-1 isoform X3 n=1 Tax=Synchiropus splendidus TaxID=270530 RepID=UPI00237E2A7E|nr:arfaptin-1 isoform X3 [Synchiropus splendidus]
MSDVSLEAESQKTSPEDSEVDYKEAEETEESLSEDVEQDRGSLEDDGLYDVDINSEEEEEVVQEEEKGIQSERAVLECDAAHVTNGVENVGREENRHVDAEAPRDERADSPSKEEITMAEEFHRSSAAEIPVTSNGDLEQNPESVFNRESYSGAPAALNFSDACVTSSNFASTTEGIIESGPFKGAAKPAPDSGAMVLADDLKSPAMEKLELVRKWSINTYKCTRQILSEKLGRGSRTVDLELETQIEVLRDNRRKYQHVIKLAQTLANQLSQIMQTQQQLGEAFADLSLKTPELHEEFGYNASTQKLLSKNGEALLGAINFFISSVDTLVDKTIEDTMMNIKQYESARVEYDAYRTDLEELNLGPRDGSTMPKIEYSQQQFQIHREKYERMRNNVSVKLKFLEENKVKVLHNQLTLFHNAIAAYYAGNQQQLEQTLKQFHIKLKMPGGDTPSWLEER